MSVVCVWSRVAMYRAGMRPTHIHAYTIPQLIHHPPTSTKTNHDTNNKQAALERVRARAHETLQKARVDEVGDQQSTWLI